MFSDPELISLDEYVFNTEAHPLKTQDTVEGTIQGILQCGCCACRRRVIPHTPLFIY